MTPKNPHPTLTVFGASRGLGKEVVVQALQAGWTVRAFARHPQPLTELTLEDEERQRLHLHQGSVYDPEAVGRAVAEVDGVVCALGAPALSSSRVRSEGTKMIVDAMERHGVERLVCCSVFGVHETRKVLPFVYRRLVFPTYLRRTVADHERQEDVLRISSLEWVAVRPPSLTDGPATAGFLHGELTPAQATFRISRADVAAFMLEQVTSRDYVGQTPGISDAKPGVVPARSRELRALGSR